MKVVRINKNKPAELWTQYEILSDQTTDWMIPLYECQDNPQIQEKFRVSLAMANSCCLSAYEKAKANLAKHGVDFFDAMSAFLDDKRVISTDEAHSESEPRQFCIGKVRHRILTVRFTYREDMIRIFGAGHWRKGRAIYGKEK